MSTGKKDEVRLHLGCGKRFIPGFTHVDLSDFPHIEHRRDTRDLSCFPNGFADLIYASHVLEYFDRTEVIPVLNEWRRVLKAGGTLRLAVPDFAALIKVYDLSQNLDKVLGPLFGRWEYEKGKCIYHKTVYDFKSLAGVLESTGFGNVRQYDWRETIHKDYDDYSQAYYPHMDKDHGLLISLNVEATKG